MSELRVASRYAKSLIDLAIERNELEQVFNDIKSFLAAAKASSELVAVLKNPIVPIDKKGKILSALFAGRVSKTVEIINQSIPGMKEGLSFLKPFFLQV